MRIQAELDMKIEKPYYKIIEEKEEKKHKK